MFFRKMPRSTLLFPSATSSNNTKDKLFENIYGYDNDRYFGMVMITTL
jgi:hypothetical protein